MKPIEQLKEIYDLASEILADSSKFDGVTKTEADSQTVDTLTNKINDFMLNAEMFGKDPDKENEYKAQAIEPVFEIVSKANPTKGNDIINMVSVNYEREGRDTITNTLLSGENSNLGNFIENINNKDYFNDLYDKMSKIDSGKDIDLKTGSEYEGKALEYESTLNSIYDKCLEAGENKDPSAFVVGNELLEQTLFDAVKDKNVSGDDKAKLIRDFSDKIYPIETETPNGNKDSLRDTFFHGVDNYVNKFSEKDPSINDLKNELNNKEVGQETTFEVIQGKSIDSSLMDAAHSCGIEEFGKYDKVVENSISANADKQTPEIIDTSMFAEVRNAVAESPKYENNSNAKISNFTGENTILFNKNLGVFEYGVVGAPNQLENGDKEYILSIGDRNVKDNSLKLRESDGWKPLEMSDKFYSAVNDRDFSKAGFELLNSVYEPASDKFNLIDAIQTYKKNPDNLSTSQQEFFASDSGKEVIEHYDSFKNELGKTQQEFNYVSEALKRKSSSENGTGSLEGTTGLAYQSRLNEAIQKTAILAASSEFTKDMIINSYTDDKIEDARNHVLELNSPEHNKLVDAAKIEKCEQAMEAVDRAKRAGSTINTMEIMHMVFNPLYAAGSLVFFLAIPALQRLFYAIKDRNNDKMDKTERAIRFPFFSALSMQAKRDLYREYHLARLEKIEALGDKNEGKLDQNASTPLETKPVDVPDNNLEHEPDVSEKEPDKEDENLDEADAPDKDSDDGVESDDDMTNVEDTPDDLEDDEDDNVEDDLDKEESDEDEEESEDDDSEKDEDDTEDDEDDSEDDEDDEEESDDEEPEDDLEDTDDDSDELDDEQDLDDVDDESESDEDLPEDDVDDLEDGDEPVDDDLDNELGEQDLDDGGLEQIINDNEPLEDDTNINDSEANGNEVRDDGMPEGEPEFSNNEAEPQNDDKLESMPDENPEDLTDPADQSLLGSNDSELSSKAKELNDKFSELKELMPDAKFPSTEQLANAKGYELNALSRACNTFERLNDSMTESNPDMKGDDTSALCNLTEISLNPDNGVSFTVESINADNEKTIYEFGQNFDVDNADSVKYGAKFNEVNVYGDEISKENESPLVTMAIDNIDNRLSQKDNDSVGDFLIPNLEHSDTKEITIDGVTYDLSEIESMSDEDKEKVLGAIAGAFDKEAIRDEDGNIDTSFENINDFLDVLDKNDNADNNNDLFENDNNDLDKYDI